DAVAARGVYHARLGRRDPALADARAALALGDQAVTLYQVAGIFALTSRQEPGDRHESLRLLAIALRKDPSWLRVVPADHGPDPTRDGPESRDWPRARAVVPQAGARGSSNLREERRGRKRQLEKGLALWHRPGWGAP